MKKHLRWAIPLGLIIIVGMNAMGSYNGFVDAEERVGGLWADVETQYQRRFDLIPNLVATVQGVADFEKSTLVEVTQARASAMQAMQQVGEGGSVADFDQKNMVFGSALRGMLGYSEQYPELKANQNFMDLQHQLEGTENRVAVARRDFNNGVKGYNSQVRKIPGSFWAGMLGFEKKEYFEAAVAAAEAPKVNFGE